MEIQVGVENQRKWICGFLPVGPEETLYVDSRTGEGLDRVCSLLYKFFCHKNRTIKFPTYSSEDLLHEIYVLAIEAIPSYDISKKANLITFLQSHVSKRLVNKCKWFSQIKRQATLANISNYKTKCRSCRRFSVLLEGREAKCEFCGSCEPPTVKYNLPVAPVYFEDAMNFSSWVGERCDLEKELQLRIDFRTLHDEMNEEEKQIVFLTLEGYRSEEIAKHLNMPRSFVMKTLNKLRGLHG